MRNLVKYVGIGLLVMGLAAVITATQNADSRGSCGKQRQRTNYQPAGR